MKVVDIPLDKIKVGDRLRAVDADYVKVLARSIDDGDLQTPVIVGTPWAGGMHHLVAGAHRLEAMRMLGRKTIPAVVLDGDALRRRLVEIDENLYRRELTALDRAAHLAERKRVWEALYPDTKQGKAGAVARWHKGKHTSYTVETAKKVGLSIRSIEMAVKMHNSIAPDVRQRIVGTWLAGKGIELNTLCRLGHTMQRKAVEMVLGADNPPASIAKAVKIINGQIERKRSPDEEGFIKLLTTWERARPGSRKQFLDYLRETGIIVGVADRPGRGRAVGAGGKAGDTLPAETA